MHGTWVNDEKVPVGQDYPIHSGDVLTFGTEVTRGAGISIIHIPSFANVEVKKC